jgi:hypothetical protein
MSVIVPLHLNGFDEVGGLGRVLSERQFVDLTAERIGNVFEGAGEVLLIVELVCGQLDHLDSVHLSHSLIQLLKVTHIETILSQICALNRQVVRLQITFPKRLVTPGQLHMLLCPLQRAI